MNKNFTLETYKALLQEIEKSYCIITVKNHFSFFKDTPPNFLILRHDVDRRPLRAWVMALLEARLGITSTYYFRRNCFDAYVIECIASLGHEVGYHYEVVDSVRGTRIDVAQGIFERDLAWLRKIAKVSTVSFHGNPLSRWRNQDFWDYFEPEQFDLLGDANLGIEDEDIYFASDNGRGWNSPYNVKDLAGEFWFERLPYMESTEHLISIINSKDFSDNPCYPKLYLSVHPNRWTSNRWEWWGQWMEDKVVNWVKQIKRR